MRPRGIPPIPIATSRLMAPVEIDSMTAPKPSSPMRMIAPVPYDCSIWESAVSRAFFFWSGFFDSALASLIFFSLTLSLTLLLSLTRGSVACAVAITPPFRLRWPWMRGLGTQSIGPEEKAKVLRCLLGAVEAYGGVRDPGMCLRDVALATRRNRLAAYDCPPRQKVGNEWKRRVTFAPVSGSIAWTTPRPRTGRGGFP